jgi:signal peptidase I
LIAAVLSALLPGLGQLFLRKFKTSGLLLLALIAISLGFWPLRLPRSYSGILLLIWLLLPLSWFAILDALLARDSPSAGRMSRWWILAGVPLSYVGVNIVFTPLLLGSGFRPVKNISSSMEPTIFIDEKLVIDENYYHHQQVQRGDLAAIRRHLKGSATTSGRDEDLLLIKRVVAVPGDTIEGRDKQIFLNGERQDEPYIQHKSKAGADPLLDTFGPVKVPLGKYFLMGDNRDISLDSRIADFGLIDDAAIVGRPLYGYRIVGNPLSWELH